MRASAVQLPLPRAGKVLSAAAFMADMKASLRAMVEGSGLSRPHFVDAMNEYARLADRSLGATPFISPATFDKLLSDEERGQLPTLWQLEVMTRVSRSLAAHACWLALHDCGLMDIDARLKVEFAELELEKTAKAKRRKALKARLMENA